MRSTSSRRLRGSGAEVRVGVGRIDVSPATDTRASPLRASPERRLARPDPPRSHGRCCAASGRLTHMVDRQERYLALRTGVASAAAVAGLTFSRGLLPRSGPTRRCSPGRSPPTAWASARSPSPRSRRPPSWWPRPGRREPRDDHSDRRRDPRCDRLRRDPRACPTRARHPAARGERPTPRPASSRRGAAGRKAGHRLGQGVLRRLPCPPGSPSSGSPRRPRSVGSSLGVPRAPHGPPRRSRTASPATAPARACRPRRGGSLASVGTGRRGRGRAAGAGRRRVRRRRGLDRIWSAGLIGPPRRSRDAAGRALDRRRPGSRPPGSSRCRGCSRGSSTPTTSSSRPTRSRPPVASSRPARPAWSRFDDIGKEGRRFVLMALTAEEIGERDGGAGRWTRSAPWPASPAQTLPRIGPTWRWLELEALGAYETIGHRRGGAHRRRLRQLHLRRGAGVPDPWRLRDRRARSTPWCPASSPCSRPSAASRMQTLILEGSATGSPRCPTATGLG